MMLRTLIIEDNVNFRNTFMDALGKRFPSMVLDVAVNGAEAMEKVKSFHPDVIFMDIRLDWSLPLKLRTNIRNRLLSFSPNTICLSTVKRRASVWRMRF